ncbi:ATP-binding protein [Streptomyces populi]|uniref:ATP-binding protein n=1 Tax=Streptomyces populi TaxID=2058924 RepID=UPI0035E0E3AA
MHGPGPRRHRRRPGPADADSIRVVQFELGQWLIGLGCVGEDESSLQHAVVELVTNSVEHAYPDKTSNGATVSVRGRLAADGVVHVEVGDQGRWLEQPQPDPFRGRGLAMVELFTDRSEVEHGDSGTTVRTARRLRRPVSIAEGSRTATPAERQELVVEETLDAPAV